MSATINDVRIDDPLRPYIIAEASGNHGQHMGAAFRLVELAAGAGADAVKFQTFTPESICADVPILTGHDARHDAWIDSLGVSRMRELFSKGGLPRAWHLPLKAHAESFGIAFLSTPFSLEDARFLVGVVGVQAIKIASGDMTFTPLIAYASSTNLPIILSTGGATMKEVGDVVKNVPLAYKKWINELVVLHCCSSYPSSPEMVNLRCISTMREYLGVPIGLSDHTLSVDIVPEMATALGATVIEKHIRLENDSTSVDVGHSLSPTEFAAMARNIRTASKILGSGEKVPHKSELHDRLWARRDPSDWLRPTKAARNGAWQ